MRDFGWLENEFWDASLYLFAGRPVLTSDISIEFLCKKKQKKFDVNTRVPRRARWDFWGVVDDTLFLYLEFDMNKYLKNWGNYEVLQIELREFIVTIFFIYETFLALRCFCLQFWNLAVLSALHMP